MSSRIFLVGNGISLRKTNFELLTGKDSMAVNKIHKFYSFTDWRPTHYVKVDYSAFDPDNWKSEILQHVNNGEQCLLWDAFRAGANPYDGNYEYIPDGIGDFPNVRYISRCEHHYLRTAAWHGLCTGLNSIVTMALWAVELGYKEIILVGCDGFFSDPKTDHFAEDYYTRVDETYADRNNENIIRAHVLLHEKCPIPIYDATVNGHLNIHRKVRLEDYV